MQHYLVETNEHAIVDLAHAHKLKSLPRLRVDPVDTTDSHGEGQTRLLRNVEVAKLLSIAEKVDLTLFSLLVLLQCGYKFNLFNYLQQGASGRA